MRNRSHRHFDVLQLNRSELLESGIKRVMDLPFHIYGNANSTNPGHRLDPRSDVYSIAVDIALAVHDVADVNADS
jgi:hypothetical protein